MNTCLEALHIIILKEGVIYYRPWNVVIYSRPWNNEALQ